MLEKIILRNFRGYREHSLPLRPLSVIVGKNNAGKSTIVEAFRLISAVANRAEYLTFKPPPEWLDIPAAYRGVSPSLKGINFEFRNVCHNYGDPPAVITGQFTGGREISVYIDSAEEDVFAVIHDKGKSQVVSRSQVARLALEGVYVLPPVGPLAQHETGLVPEYVRASLDTNLAPAHFRNQLRLLYDEHYQQFVTLAESSWPGLQIRSFDIPARSTQELSLMVRDGGFVAEVGWMGHGLQTWLQTVWFLARVPSTATIILDEPDIYLHADIQRKLIRLLAGRYQQVIVATHSEVSPEDILIVDKKSKSSKFAVSIPAVQQVIDQIGGIHSLQLSRFWSARRCLFVEGDDIDILRVLYERVLPESRDSIQYPVCLWAEPEIGN